MTEAKRLALVTGASSGIGLALATEFVQHDYDLVVCAEDEAIHEAADALSVSGAVITPIQVDLRTYDGVESLYSTVRGTGRSLDAAALNAGVGLGGPFVENDLTAELDMIDLNSACAPVISMTRPQAVQVSRYFVPTENSGMKNSENSRLCSVS